MNRIREHLEGLDDEPTYGDFVVVSGPFGSVSVTYEAAREVERQLDRRKRWIVFRDRSGSRLRVRARDVRSLCESTVEQRAADRRFAWARRREEESDPRASEDD